MTKDHLYPEEVRAQAIDRRRRKFARQHNEVVVLGIEDITTTEDNRIYVKTGQGDGHGYQERARHPGAG